MTLDYTSHSAPGAKLASLAIFRNDIVFTSWYADDGLRYGRWFGQLGRAARKFRLNMPNPIPVVMLGRLVVDLSLARRGVGRGVFKDAVQSIAHAADTIGVRRIVVHPISDDARAFYLKLGFLEWEGDPRFMVCTLKDARQVLYG